MKVLRTRSVEEKDRELARDYRAEAFAARLEEDRLYLPGALLEDLGAALRAPGLVLLAGPSGSGKSSLAESLARHLTEGYPDQGWARVAVRPDWQGPGPLLGTWDEQALRYRTAPFLELWLRALRHKARRFYLILDGIDRAPPERYLAEVLAAGDREASLYLHEDHLRCQPRAGLSDDLSNFFVCHQDCGECFFVVPGYPQGVTDAVRDFVPARAQRPPNLVILATVDGDPAALPAGIRDRAALVSLPGARPAALLEAGLLPAMEGLGEAMEALAAALEPLGEAPSVRTWRAVDALVGEGECPARALRVRAGAALARLDEEEARELLGALEARGRRSSSSGTTS